MKDNTENIERKKLGLSIILIRIVLVCIIIVCATIIVSDFTKKEEKQDLAKKVKEEAVVENSENQDKDAAYISPIDFDILHETNPDIYAWIKVPGTNVDYPILQSPEGYETDYYLETNLDGSKGLPGCIYTQLRNAKDFSDRDTIVYGHDMKDGSMFNSLHNYEDSEFFYENRYIYVYTPDAERIYQIFAAIAYDDRLILDYYNDFRNPDDFDEYLSDIKNYSGTVADDVEVTSDDRIITLSTCIATAPSNRYLVIGKLLSK